MRARLGNASMLAVESESFSCDALSSFDEEMKVVIEDEKNTGKWESSWKNKGVLGAKYHDIFAELATLGICILLIQ